MGIESTKIVKRSEAIEMLNPKCMVYDNDCIERLEYLLYEHSESIFEYINYIVVEDDYKEDDGYRRI
jgi:hypothetical protein